MLNENNVVTNLLSVRLIDDDGKLWIDQKMLFEARVRRYEGDTYGEPLLDYISDQIIQNLSEKLQRF